MVYYQMIGFAQNCNSGLYLCNTLKQFTHIFTLHFQITPMPFDYHNPNTVTQPGNIISNITVLHDDGEKGFSLARLDCEGVQHMAMRWNVARKEYDDADKQAGKVKCTGAPSVHGVPSWFILPRELFDPAFMKNNNFLLDDLTNQPLRSEEQQSAN